MKYIFYSVLAILGFFLIILVVMLAFIILPLYGLFLIFRFLYNEIMDAFYSRREYEETSDEDSILDYIKNPEKMRLAVSNLNKYDI